MILYTIWLFNIAMENHHAIKNGKPLFLWAIGKPWLCNSHNQRVMNRNAQCVKMNAPNTFFWKYQQFMINTMDPNQQACAGWNVWHHVRIIVVSTDLRHLCMSSENFFGLHWKKTCSNNVIHLPTSPNNRRDAYGSFTEVSKISDHFNS